MNQISWNLLQMLKKIISSKAGFAIEIETDIETDMFKLSNKPDLVCGDPELVHEAQQREKLLDWI